MKQAAKFLVIVLAGALLSRAQAGDLMPPCWRGDAGSTLQIWDFSTNANPATPEFAVNPNGSPTATVNVGFGGAAWQNNLFIFGTNQGIWDLGKTGVVHLAIPNEPVTPGAWKYISLQVQQYRDSLYGDMATVTIPGAVPLGSQLKTNNLTPFGGGRWVVQQSTWLLDPSVAAETITITAGNSGGAIDQVIVDTIARTGDDGDQFVPCWRGLAQTTHQSWSFHTAATLSPEQDNNPGSPTASITTGSGGLGWFDQPLGVGCRQGFWDLGNAGTMTLNVPDAVGSPDSYKYVQVQVVRFYGGIFIFPDSPTVTVTAGSSTVTPMGSMESLPWEMGLLGQWLIEKTVWRVAPDSGPVTVTITAPGGGALVDQVTVDTLALDPLCPTDQVLVADAGQCGKTNVTWALPAVDACIITNIVSIPPNGSTFPVGVTAVTNWIQDSLGGEKICTFTVTVSDLELPMITCPTDIVVTNDPIICGAAVNFAAAVTDNCAVTNISYSPPSGSTFPLGTTVVTAFAQDSSGNVSASCNFTVQVVDLSGDVLAPCWRGQPGTTFQHWAFADSNGNPLPDAQDNPGSPTAEVVLGMSGLGWFDTVFNLGCRQGYWDLGAGGTITCEVPDVAGSATSYKYVQVQVVHNRDGLAFTLPPIVSVSAGGATVTQVGADVEIGLLPIQPFSQWVVHQTTWRIATNSGPVTVAVAGPSSGALIDQIIIDTLPQDYTCPTDIVGVADFGQCSKSNVTWSLPPVDGCVITNVICVPTVGSAFHIGTNAVALLIYDNLGETNVCNFNVIIADDQPPIAACKNITVNLDAFGAVTITGLDVDDGSSDNCGIATWAVAPNSFTCANVGSNLVTLTVADVNGLVATCEATVTVVDNVLPVFVCPGAITNVADIGVCSATFVLPPLLASDNCGIASISSNAPASFPVGITPVIWEVVDVNGNTNSCVQLVVIEDLELPTLVCPANLVTNVTVDCSQVVVWPDLVAADNCAVTNIVCIPASGSLFAVGTTTVNCTVWDSSGNTNNCSFTVTVNANADLAVTMMSAAPSPVTLGSNLVYTVTISNAGPCAAVGVVVSNAFSVGQVSLLATNQADPGMGNPFPGPAAWWRAENTGDDSVGANHGTLAGGVSYVGGTAGQSFSFDGTSGSVAVPDALELRPASLTIEGWIKIQDVTGVHVIIGKRLGAGTADSYSLWIGSGILFASMADGIGSGPFMTYPEFPTFSYFQASDLVDMESFALKLQPPSPADLVSWFIKTNLSLETTTLLAAYTSGADPDLLKHLIGDLNSIISNGSVYEPTRFAAVTLAAETQYIQGRNPSGPDLVRLNRFLIRDAYAAEFATVIFSQLNNWFHVAYSFDAVAQAQALYVNGVLVNAGFVNKTIAYDAHPVLIGADDDNGPPGYFYQGEIDELTLYPRALTGAEIQAVYRAGSAGKAAVAGTVAVGTIPAGATAEVSFVAMPIECPAVNASATVFSQTPDPVSANDTASAAAVVQELPASEWLLDIQRVSPNNNLLRITWPLACGGLSLETTANLMSPVIWTPAVLPVQLIENRQATILPADEPMRYFRATTP